MAINSTATITLRLNVEAPELNSLKESLTGLAAALNEGGGSKLIGSLQGEIARLGVEVENATKRATAAAEQAQQADQRAEAVKAQLVYTMEKEIAAARQAGVEEGKAASVTTRGQQNVKQALLETNQAGLKAGETIQFMARDANGRWAKLTETIDNTDTAIMKVTRGSNGRIMSTQLMSAKEAADALNNSLQSTTQEQMAEERVLNRVRGEKQEEQAEEERLVKIAAQRISVEKQLAAEQAARVAQTQKLDAADRKVAQGELAEYKQMNQVTGALQKQQELVRQIAGLQSRRPVGNQEDAARVAGQYRELMLAIKNVNTEEGDATRTLAYYDKELNRVTSDQGKLRNELNTVSGRLSYFEKQWDAVFRASYRFRAVGQQLIMWAQMFVQHFTGLMDTFGNFEFMINRAAAALNIWNDNAQGTTIGVSDLEKAVLSLRREVALIPAEDVAKALYFWGSTTGQVVQTQDELKNTMDELTPVMQAAVMTETDYETAIKGVYSILSQYYNGSLLETKHVTELLFQATQKTAAEFPDLINSFKMMGPIAKANNVTFEDMAQLLGNLANLGIRGTMAGRALRQMFLQLVAPTDKARGALNQLFANQGQSYMNTIFPNGKFVGIDAYISALAKALTNAGATVRNAFLKGIGTANEAPVLIALINQKMREQAGAAKDDSDSLRNAASAADLFSKTWERHMQSWKFQIGQLQGSFETLQMVIGAAIAKGLDPFIQKAIDITDKVRAWAEANPGIVITIAKMGAALAGLAAAAGTIATVAGAFMGLWAVLRVAASAFGAFLAPATITLALVAALGKAVIDNAGYIQTQLTRAQQTIQQVFGDGADAVKGFGDAINAIAQPLENVMGLVVRVVADLVVHFANLIKLVTDINRQFPILIDALGTIAGLFATAFVVSKMSDFAKSIVNVVFNLTGVNKVLGSVQAQQLVYAEAIDATQAAQVRLNEAIAIGADEEILLARQAQLASAQMNLATAAPGKMATAFEGLMGKISKFAGVAGMIAGVGLIIYESIPPVHDFVDSVINGFKSIDQKVAETNGHIKDVLDNLGGFGVAQGTALRASMSAALDSASQQWKSSTLTFNTGVDITGHMAPVNVTTPFQKITYTNRNGDVLGPFTDLKSLQDAIRDDYSQLADSISNEVASAVESSARLFGARGVDSNRVLEAINSATRTTGMYTSSSGRAIIATLVSSVIGNIDPASTKQQIAKALQDKLNSMTGLGRYASEVLGQWIDKISGDLVSGSAQTAKAVADKVSQADASPVVTGLLSGLQTLADDTSGKLTASDFSARASAMWADAMSKGFDIKNVSQGMADQLNALMIQFGTDFNDNGDIVNIADQVLSTFNTFLDSLNSALSYQAAKITAQAYEKFRPTFDDLATQMWDGSQQAMVKAFQDIQTLAPNMLGDNPALGDAFKGPVVAALQLLVQNNIPGAAELMQQLQPSTDAAASAGSDAAAQSASEIADSIVSGWTSGLDFKKKIRDAMKSNDLHNLGKLLTQTLDPVLQRGLRAKNNIAANDYAQAWLTQITTQIGAVLTSGSSAEKARVTKSLGNFLADASKRLPKMEFGFIKTALQTALTGIDPSTLPASLIKKLEHYGIHIAEAVQTGVNSVTVKPPTINVPTPVMKPLPGNSHLVGDDVVRGPMPKRGPSAYGKQTSASEKALNALKSTADSVKSAIDDTFTRVEAAATTAGATVIDNFAAAFGGGSSYDTLSTNLSGIGTLVSTALDMSGGGTTWGSGTINAFASAIVPTDALYTNLGAIKSAVAGPLSSLGSGGGGPNGGSSPAFTWGSDIGTQLAAGMNSVAGVVAKAADGLATAISDRLKHTSPKKGPLSNDAMTKSGKHMMENMAHGIGQGSAAVEAAVKKHAIKVKVWIKAHYNDIGKYVAGHWVWVTKYVTDQHKKHEKQTHEHHKHIIEASKSLHDAIIAYLKKNHAEALKWLLQHHQNVLAYMKKNHPEALRSLEASLKKNSDNIKKTTKGTSDALKSQLKSLEQTRNRFKSHLQDIEKEIRKLTQSGDRSGRLRYLKQMESDYKKSISNINDHIDKLHHRGVHHTGVGNGGNGGGGGGNGGGGHGGTYRTHAHLLTVDRINTNRLDVDGTTLITHAPKRVKIEISVTSPDGTANRMTLADMRKAVKESFGVAELEHYLTVG